MTSKETLRPALHPYPGPLPDSRADYAYGNVFNNCDVSFGVPFTTACAKHAEETFHATRVFILSSATLANSTSALSDLKAALGAKVAGVKFGFKAHTYFSEIFDTAEECRGLGVDLIVTLGGGSLTDLAKMITLVLANNVHDAVELLKLPTMVTAGTVPPAKNPTVPVICVSTTLSGGEYTLGCGTTDDRDNQKHQFTFGAAIKLVILDAQLVADTTPPLLFLQSGVRALDHCIEALCSPYCNEVTEMHAKASLERLVPGLLRCKADGDAKTDVDARLLCQMASIDAIASVARVYTPVGGSHAIGHILGPFGVVHGATSGILLPAVCKYNARHSPDAAARQAGAKVILWGVPEMRRLAERKGLVEGVADLGDLLDALVRGLGMARTLAEVGVGQDKFDKLAEFSLLDPFAPTNPVPLKEKAQVMEILEIVAE
ncbi:Fe-containing alcohol dehydrogenase [Mycena venus]|uniref:Fe-containing alcohol dehydrogenase n=1 Tax=Mycena venus TaxID=2733690 RepID=A0A8H6XKV1_9AGAR|nr:Fe-containing alcohol dehydrogenase [Mycena venus]